MSTSAYRVEVCDRIFDENGKDLAIDINDADCIVRISRRGDLAAVARAMLNLGIELGSRGIIALPIVGVVGADLL